MRDGWRDVAVEEVAQVVGGGTPKSGVAEFWGGDVQWLTPKDLSDRPARYTSSGARTITEAGVRGSGAKLLPAGAVLLTSRAPVGYVSIASGPVATNQGFKSLLLDETQSPEFWYYLLGHSTEYLRANSGGSTFQELSGGSLRKLRFVVPPLVEQQRIVDLIAAVDAAIAAGAAQRVAVLELQAQLRDRPVEGVAATLGELLVSLDSGTSTKPVQGEGARANLLSLAAIRPGVFDPSQVKDVGTARLPDKARLRDGDLLITRSNTPDRVGYVSLARQVPRDTYIPDLVWRIVPDEALVSKEFLAEYLSSPRMRTAITASASGTSQSMRKINKTNFAALSLPRASLEQQEAYLSPLRPLSQQRAALESSQRRLQELRSHILTALLSGEHEIPDSYDELLAG